MVNKYGTENENEDERPDRTSHIDDYYDQVISESQKEENDGFDSYNCDITEIKFNNDEVIITFVIYGDNDSKTFIYDKQLQTWINSNTEEAPNGIDENGCVTMLDFRGYTEA